MCLNSFTVVTAVLCPQVCANIMEYCQTLLLQSSAQAQFSICLFSPSGSEPAGRDGGRTGQRYSVHTKEGERDLTPHMSLHATRTN